MQRLRNRALKLEVIAAYGRECRCCGEADWRKLTVDHVNGDGHSHRKKYGSAGFYHRLKADGFPQDRFQLLCWSCNAVKHYFPGEPCCQR
jgi:hypothetical protein